MELDTKAMGQRIAQARKEAGIATQQELGDLLGVSRRSVQFYEEGKTVPYRHFRTLEALTGRDVAFFLYGREAEEGGGSAGPDWRELRDVLSARHEAVMGRLDAMDERLRESSRVLGEVVARLERLEAST